MSKLNDATGFYNSKAWHDTRNAYLKSVGNLCERCLEQGKIEPAVIVHHKKPLNIHNVSDLELSLGHKNLQALCRKCHAEVHDEMYRKRTGRRYKVDRYGKVVICDTVL